MSYTDTDPEFFFWRVWSGATYMDEMMTIRKLPDGRVLIQTDVPHRDLPAEAEIVSIVAGEAEALSFLGALGLLPQGILFAVFRRYYRLL